MKSPCLSAVCRVGTLGHLGPECPAMLVSPLPEPSPSSTVPPSTTERPGPSYQLPHLYLPGRLSLKVFPEVPAFAVRSMRSTW